MKKRITAIIIAFIMLLSMLPVMALADDSSFISLDKSIYTPNEEMTVTVSGITQQMVEDEAYVSIYKAGSSHDAYMSWSYLEEGSSQLTFEAPAEPGSYEMRLYNKDHEYTDETFVMSVPFTVSMQKQGKISLEKSAYKANQEISITVTEITEEMERAGAYVSIYKKSAKHNEYGVYEYVKAGSSVVKLTAPNLNGEFEMRLYSINHNYTDESFVMSVPFTLSGAVTQQSSDWAKPEIARAAEMGLIPDSLKSADLTKPITRAEFCELAVKLYEKSTGTNAVPASPNPFTDTNNNEILKAYKLGITQGTSATAFSPNVLINREQCATMLFRAIKAIKPDGDYSIAGVSDFPDQKNISSYAVESTKFMSKLGIIKGDSSGNFMPKATTTAQTAAGYGMATREAAILMGVRSYDKVGDIKTAAAPSQTGATGNSVIGTWVLGTLSGGNFNSATGKYEGGASGLGQYYTFKADGTYTALVIWSNTMYFSGKYSVKDGALTLTDRSVEESSDGGSTWGAAEKLPDTSAYFIAGTNESGKYLLMGQEGAVPPLVDKDNALKYMFKE